MTLQLDRRQLIAAGGIALDVLQLIDLGRQVTGADAGTLTADYGSSMIDFIRTDLGEDPWEKQEEIVEAVDQHPRTAVASCHGAGKSRIAAVIAVAWLHTRVPSVVLTTAPTDRQVRNILWREINAVYRRARVPLLGRPLQTRVEVAPDHYAMGFSAGKPGKESDDEADSWQGFHGANVLLIPDESAGINQKIMDSLDAVMSAGDSHTLLIGNPTSTSGTFHAAFHRERHLWRGIKISAEDTPNFHMGRSVDEPDDDRVEFHEPDHLPRPYLTRPAWANYQIKKRGLRSPWVQARVFANFPTQGTSKLIAMPWIEAANERRVAEEELSDKLWYGGLDVARFGEDENVLTIRHGLRIVRQVAWTGLDLVQSTAKAESTLARFPTLEDLLIDVIGVGGGLADNLRHLGHNVTDVNVSEKSSDPEEWPNLRHEGWWQLRERFRLGNIAGPIDEEAMAQLSDLEYGYVAGYTGAIIEPKDKTKQRTHTSPDRAESIMLAFLRMPVRGMAGGFKQRTSRGSGWSDAGRPKENGFDGKGFRQRLRKAYTERG